jgi:hypothetical protein
MKFVTRLLLVAALLLSAAAAGASFLPWYTAEGFDQDERIVGLGFVEGLLELALGVLGFVFFLAVVLRSDTPGRRRLALVAVCLAMGTAFVPLELIARGAWMGLKTVVVIGGGYVGWSYGLYLSLTAGFSAAATGSVGASTILRRPGPVPVKLRQLRKAPRAPGGPAP